MTGVADSWHGHLGRDRLDCPSRAGSPCHGPQGQHKLPHFWNTMPEPSLNAYLDAHRSDFEEELCEFLRIPSVERQVRAPRRHAPGGRVGGRPVPPPALLRRSHPHGRPSAGLCRVARRCRGTDRPGLRPLRRAAGRSAGEVDHPPVRADRRDGNLYARGATDDKGQMLTHVQERRGVAGSRSRPAAAELEVPHRGRGGGRQQQPGEVHRGEPGAVGLRLRASSATAASSPPACRPSPMGCGASPITSCGCPGRTATCTPARSAARSPIRPTPWPRCWPA